LLHGSTISASGNERREGRRGKKEDKGAGGRESSATCSIERRRHREVATGGDTRAPLARARRRTGILPSYGRSAPLDTRRRGVATRAPLHVVADLDRDFVPIVPRNPNHQRCLLLAARRGTRERMTRGTGGEVKEGGGEERSEGEMRSRLC